MRKILLFRVVPLVIIFIIAAAVVINNPIYRNDHIEEVFIETEDPEEAEELFVPPLLDPLFSSRWDDGTACGFFVADLRPRSMLTGLPTEEEYLDRRPIAVVINNLHRAMPQSGISYADVIYEVLTEGDVTRLVGIFQSYVPEKIGPVRSARDSFIDFAYNHDAIFVHHGRSPDADTRLRNTGITNLDGMALDGSVFLRYRNYPSWHHNTGQRPLEHSSFLFNEPMLRHIENRGIRSYVNSDPAYGFNFGNVPEHPVSGVANTIVVPFSVPYTRTFIFDEETGLYLVENREGPVRDANTEEQVSVANILIQITTKRVTGSLGQRTIGTVGSGEGFFVTGGIYRPVLWAKDSHTSPMRWYFTDGTPLVLSPGQTWICVFQNTGTVSFE